MGEETVSSMYSRLFRLPRLSRVFALGTCLSLVFGLLVVFAFTPLLTGVLSGFSLFGVSLLCFMFLLSSLLVSSCLSNQFFMRGIQKVMTFRRALGVSLFSLALTTGVFVIGWIVFALTGWASLTVFLILGLASGFVIRLLVDSVMLQNHLGFSIADSLSQPLLDSVFFLWSIGLAWFIGFLFRFLIVASIFAVSTILYVRRIGFQLKRLTGVDGRLFFGSFLSEWGGGFGGELEKIIERNSIRKDLQIAEMSFRNRRGRMKLVLVVPTIHPGPFRGLGSSDLPDYLMRNFEEDFGCLAICAHGPSTHGENLVRSSQNKDIYKQILKVLEDCPIYQRSSPVVRVTSAGVSVICQIFGEFALLIGGASPLTPIDDISLDAGEAAITAAKRFVKEAFFVDSHSCIDPSSDYVWPGSKTCQTFMKAAAKAAQRAAGLARSVLKMGAAKIRSTGISISEGMGKEGASAIVMHVGAQRVAYIFFDSNNLVSRLKAAITKELIGMGFDEVEVFTSDTHSTSALSPGKIGYNPLGYSTPADRILGIAKSAVAMAEKDLEDVSVSAGVHILKNVKVAGEENMRNILEGTRKSLSVAKSLAPVAFGMATLLSAIMLLLL